MHTHSHTQNEIIASNAPVFWVQIAGDFKEKVSKHPNVFTASFEAHVNKTIASVKAGLLNRTQQRKAIKELTNELKRYGIHSPDIKYYRDGATIFQNSLN